MQSNQVFIILGAVSAFLTVALGAFGAHALETLLSEQALQTWQTAVDYHGFHSLGLIITGLLISNNSRITMAGWWMLAGIILFSGSLYLLSVTGIKALGMITPIGGSCLLISWLLIAWHTIKQASYSDNL